MTEDERRHYEKQFLDHQNWAIAASRKTREALDRLIPYLQAIAEEAKEARIAQDKAIDEMLAANRAALKRYNDEQHG